MAQPSRHGRHSRIEWLRRLDRAARRMNPYLSLLAVGLTILNLMCFAGMAPQLPIYRLGADRLACPSAATGGIDAIAAPSNHRGPANRAITGRGTRQKGYAWTPLAK